jgi:hypothetical protein
MRLSQAFLGLALFSNILADSAAATAVIPRNDPSLFNADPYGLKRSDPMAAAPSQEADDIFKAVVLPESSLEAIGSMLEMPNIKVAAFRNVNGSPEIYAADGSETRILSINLEDQLVSVSSVQNVEFISPQNDDKPISAVSSLTNVFNCKLNTVTVTNVILSPEGVVLLFKAGIEKAPVERVQEVCNAREKIAHMIREGLAARP